MEPQENLDAVKKKIEKYTQKIASLKEAKKKYSQKMADIDKQLEELNSKLKSIKSDTIFKKCEELNFTIEDYIKLSNALSDGTVSELLEISAKNKMEETKNNETKREE